MQWFKNLFKKTEFPKVMRFESIEEYKKAQHRDNAKKLMRKILGSIDVYDAHDEVYKNEDDYMEYLSALAVYFPYFENKIKKLIQVQLKFQGKEADYWEQVVFSKGTINGFDLVLETLENEHNDYLERIRDKKEQFDKSKQFPEV